jgi:hypothetical protein
VAVLCEAIENDIIPRKEDKEALAAQLRSTPPEMQCMVVDKGNAKAP